MDLDGLRHNPAPRRPLGKSWPAGSDLSGHCGVARSAT